MIRSMALSLTAFFTALAFPFHASLQETARSPLPTAAALAEITERGRLLAEYDAAAWHSTDAVLALKPAEGSLGRYVAKKTGSTWIVVYGKLSDARDKFLISYAATREQASDQFAVERYDPPREDSEFYLSGARAIETALGAFSGEQRPYNVAVVPANSGKLYVYVYPARTHADVYVLGGDARYLISADGTTIEQTRRMHKSIIETKDPIKTDAAKDGYKPVMGIHNHILDDIPEDTDVLYAMTRKPAAPEMIVTWEYTYMVMSDGSIEYRGESAKLWGKKKKK